MAYCWDLTFCYRKIAIGHCLLSKTSLGQNGPVDIGGGVEVWFGHFQSVNIGWKKLFLNVDAAQRAFVKGGPVYKWMYEVLGKRENLPLSEVDIRKFSKKIATLKVTYPRGKYNAKIGVNGLKGAANREVFECEGRKVTVEQYFREKYNIRLTRPDLPCIWVGSKDKKNLVPMEVAIDIVFSFNTILSFSTLILDYFHIYFQSRGFCVVF